MSRHWSEHNYISAESLWGFIDEQVQRLELLTQNDTVESSELCKLLILGRREMLETLCEYTSNNQQSLGEMLTDTHNIFTREEIEKIKKSDYGL